MLLGNSEFLALAMTSLLHPSYRQIKIHIRGLPGILDEAIQQNRLPVVDKQY
jgi:hypothetical protein